MAAILNSNGVLRKSRNRQLIARAPRSLPPLVVEGRRPHMRTPRPPPPTPEPWSPYHRSCSQASKPRQSHRKPDSEAAKAALWAFFDKNRKYLAEYVIVVVPEAELDDWRYQKKAKTNVAAIDWPSPSGSENSNQLEDWSSHHGRASPVTILQDVRTASERSFQKDSLNGALAVPKILTPEAGSSSSGHQNGFPNDALAVPKILTPEAGSSSSGHQEERISPKQVNGHGVSPSLQVNGHGVSPTLQVNGHGAVKKNSPSSGQERVPPKDRPVGAIPKIITTQPRPSANGRPVQNGLPNGRSAATRNTQSSNGYRVQNGLPNGRTPATTMNRQSRSNRLVREQQPPIVLSSSSSSMSSSSSVTPQGRPDARSRPTNGMRHVNHHEQSSPDSTNETYNYRVINWVNGQRQRHPRNVLPHFRAQLSPMYQETEIPAAPRRPTGRQLPRLVPEQLRPPTMAPPETSMAVTAAEELVASFLHGATIEAYLVDTHVVYHMRSNGQMQHYLEHTSYRYARFLRRTVSSPVQFLDRSNVQYFVDPPPHVTRNLNNRWFVAYVPAKLGTGQYLLEIWRTIEFHAREKQLLCLFPEIASTTLKYHTEYHSLVKESKMSAFLLEVAQAVFEDMVSLDQLIKKILEVAQRLVSADRASLFLVDYKNLQLVSTVFDLRYEPNQDSDFSKKEIRMPIDKGIAGHVAMSGETMNIPDAYSDERFNKAVDEATGFRTVSILCMPIKVRGKVIAVVQMVNKRDKKAFESDDEAAFQVFSTFFGLALHNARLYDKIKRKEQKYKVALEVLGYHNTCAEEEVATILEERKKGETINYNDFELNPFEVNEVEKCKGILTMFEDLFDIKKFDITVLTRFVLTVKKNYRKVPYHNFDHGWSVANSMYVILKHDNDNRFDHRNRLALFVAALCHDLDHRGYTNKFMSDIESPLAAMYTTSTLEHHHFNMTVTILQQEGHNIFYQMSGEEFKDVLDSIRQCILATDLAALFPNLKRINELVSETPQLDWGEVSHRNLVRSFCMTCADLCAAAKPFDVQLCTVNIISAEFYLQGDLERAAGRTPIPMMDRDKPEELPACQVGFLTQICLPSYTVLQKIFPQTGPMLTMVNNNVECWKAKAATGGKKKAE